MPGPRVLIIEDEASVRSFLRIGLEGSGYVVREAMTGAEGKTAAIEFRPEIVLLDLGLPDLDGHRVLEDLRTWTTVPVIILTARDQEVDKVQALDAGADDYLTKPFGLPELLARVRVALRHARSSRASSVLRIGALEIDLEGHVVRRDGTEIRLTSTEFDMLRVLALNAGKVVTHGAFLKAVWGPHSTEHTQYLRVYIGHLRKKLERAGGGPLIETEPGVGYRLRE